MSGAADRIDLRKLLAFGTGVGIVIRGRDLEVAVARVRPDGIKVLGRTTVSGFAERPASDWGAEYTAFLRARGAGHLSATVLLPRQDVIVRTLALAGVSGRDLDSAIALQLDTLHPYGEDDVHYGFSPLGNGAVLLGILRRARLEHYAGIFSEAGIPVACFTFSAGALHGAVRLFGAPPAGFVAISGKVAPVEVYGESPSRPVFSGEFDLPVERAVALATSELRLDPQTAAVRLDEVLPAPRVNPLENDLSCDALPYAAALAGACPRLAPAANLLPPERRATNSRAMFVPTAVLAALLLLVSGALLAWSKLDDRRYLQKLQAEIVRLEPLARRAQALDRRIDDERARARLLDEFRGRSKADLDALNELTRLLPPPVWTNLIELTRDSVNINGEAEQAAALLGVIDRSPYFQNSEFTMIAKSGNNETFRIHTVREGRK